MLHSGTAPAVQAIKDPHTSDSYAVDDNKSRHVFCLFRVKKKKERKCAFDKHKECPAAELQDETVLQMNSPSPDLLRSTSDSD